MAVPNSAAQTNALPAWWRHNNANIPMGYVKFDDLEKLPGPSLGGSTGAYMVNYMGANYVYKSGANIRHAINEYIAFKLYEVAGVRVPKSYLVHSAEEPVGFILEYIRGNTAHELLLNHIMEEDEVDHLKDSIEHDYIVHALFANWDANNAENYIIPLKDVLSKNKKKSFYNYDDDGFSYEEDEAAKSNNTINIFVLEYQYKNTYVIDLGGALFYRAKGIDKGLDFGFKAVNEMDSLAKSSTGTIGEFFTYVLSSSYEKYKIINNRWKTIDQAKIINLLISKPIQSLLEKYEMTSLTKIIKGRMSVITKYCDTEAPQQVFEGEHLHKAQTIAHAIQQFTGKQEEIKRIFDMVNETKIVLTLGNNDGLPIPILKLAYFTQNDTLFYSLFSMATKEAFNATDSDNHAFLYNVLVKLYRKKQGYGSNIFNDKDFALATALIVEGALMTLDDLDVFMEDPVNILRLLDSIGRLALTQKIQGRITIADKWDQSNVDISIIEAPKHSHSTYFIKQHSLLDNNILMAKPLEDIQSWLNLQKEYIISNPRTHHIVRAYTFRGDVLANGYLRKTLTDPYDILNQIRGDTTIPFAYQIYDSYDFLASKGLSMPPKETLMMEDGITIHNKNIKDLYLANFDYFLRLHNLFPLLKAFCRDLLHIIQKAPRPSGKLIVYRGVKDEGYIPARTVDYVNMSFQSTTLNPDIAVNFTKNYFNTPMNFCVYEMELSMDSPCLYITPVSEFPHEHEILLPYNLRYTHSMDIRLKHSVTPTKFVPYLGDPYHSVSRTGMVFVRNIDVHGFSGMIEPRLHAPFNKANGKKTLKTNRRPNVRINNTHSKTLRKGNYRKTVNHFNPYNFANLSNNE